MPLIPNNSRLNQALIKNSEGILSGVEYDDIQVTYPTATTETYDFYFLTVLVATILVSYVLADKKDLLRVERTL